MDLAFAHESCLCIRSAHTTAPASPTKGKPATSHAPTPAHRRKGRIERLRVQLAYGFEARTQHQLSSSWHKGRGMGHTMWGGGGDDQPKGD
jgi:hypothetical protein